MPSTAAATKQLLPRVRSVVSRFTLSPTLASNATVARRREQGLDTFHLGFGQAPFPVPSSLKRALADNAWRQNYEPVAGNPQLREAVLDRYAAEGFDRDAYDVLICPGSKLGLFAIQLAIEGDLVLPWPCWVSYRPQARMLDRSIIDVPLELSDEGLYMDPEQLSSSISKAKKDGLNPSTIIFNSPSNPTGLCLNNTNQIASVCREEGLVVVSDEIYASVMHNGVGRDASLAFQCPERTVITSGLSKHMSLGGWRIGTLLVPKAVPELFASLSTIASETWSSVPTPIQYAAIEAYKDESGELATHIKTCGKIHGILGKWFSKQLRHCGIRCCSPQGGFYLYPDFAPMRQQLAQIGVKTSEQLCAALAERAGVVALPGSAFGANDADLTMRLALCDFDGQRALDVFSEQDWAGREEDFVAAAAPRVQEAARRFAQFVQGLIPQDVGEQHDHMAARA